MAGLILLYESYGGRVVDPLTRQQVVQLTASLAKEAGRFKASPAGQFAIQLYEKYRL